MRDFKFFTEKRQPTVETAAEILEETFISEVVEPPNPAASDNPLDAIPGNMPLTNRLDKRTYQRMPACHPCMRSVLFAVVPCVEAP